MKPVLAKTFSCLGQTETFWPPFGKTYSLDLYSQVDSYRNCWANNCFIIHRLNQLTRIFAKQSTVQSDCIQDANSNFPFCDDTSLSIISTAHFSHVSIYLSFLICDVHQNSRRFLGILEVHCLLRRMWTKQGIQGYIITSILFSP